MRKTNTGAKLLIGSGIKFKKLRAKKTRAAAIKTFKKIQKAKKGLIKAGLSQDEWHDPISQEVIDAFTGSRTWEDRRFLHKIKRPIKHGRCDWGDRIACNCCDKPFITPDGLVHQCGCPGSPVVGNAIDGYSPMGGIWACYNGLREPGKHRIITK